MVLATVLPRTNGYGMINVSFFSHARVEGLNRYGFVLTFLNICTVTEGVWVYLDESFIQTRFVIRVLHQAPSSLSVFESMLLNIEVTLSILSLGFTRAILSTVRSNTPFLYLHSSSTNPYTVHPFPPRSLSYSLPTSLFVFASTHHQLPP